MTKTSRFNYIKRGLVGVCAATMLTGLCAGAAFGASAEQTSSTVVNVTTPVLQISTNVPTSSAVTLKADGSLDQAGAMSFSATDNPYKLVVKSVKAEAANSFKINAAATMTDDNGVSATIQMGDDASTAFEISEASATAKTLANASIESSGLTFKITSLQMKNLTSANVGTSVTPFNLVWTVGVADTTPGA